MFQLIIEVIVKFMRSDGNLLFFLLSYFLEVSSFILAEVNLIGSDFAVLHITVQWLEPCGSMLDITVVYNVKNTTLNSTIKDQYHLISDKNGSIVVLRELEVNSVYEYQVFVYNATTLIIKPVNGIFKTLNNITTITPG